MFTELTEHRVEYGNAEFMLRRPEHSAKKLQFMRDSSSKCVKKATRKDALNMVASREIYSKEGNKLQQSTEQVHVHS